MPKLAVIGRLEYIEFSDLELGRLEAKVDTGAYRSSLHCKKPTLVRINGKEALNVQFQKGRTRVTRQFSKFSKTIVKSSNGLSEERFVIATYVRMNGKRYKASFTLSNRSEMKTDVLLGRKFLSKKFLVDVSKTHLLPNSNAS